MASFSQTMRTLGGEPEIDADVRRTQLTLSFFGIAGLVCLVSYSTYAATTLPTPNQFYLCRWLGVFGILGAVAFAAFCAGGLLGFLFGIPKSNTSGRPATEEQNNTESSPHYTSNTNLEEMSDWLTKIIVGASLIELKALVAFFSELVNAAATSLGQVAFASLIAGADILGFFLLGFFTVYLLTRLYLAGAFSRAQASLAQRLDRAASLVKLDFNKLTDNEKKWLAQLLEAQDQELVIPATFVRQSDDHSALRSLRDRGLIHVKENTAFLPGKTIVLTPIAKEIKTKLRAAVR